MFGFADQEVDESYMTLHIYGFSTYSLDTVNEAVTSYITHFLQSQHSQQVSDTSTDGADVSFAGDGDNDVSAIGMGTTIAQIATTPDSLEPIVQDISIEDNLQSTNYVSISRKTTLQNAHI